MTEAALSDSIGTGGQGRAALQPGEPPVTATAPARAPLRELPGPLAAQPAAWLRACFAASSPRLAELLAVAAVAHLCGLLTPLGFQVVFDRVFAQGVEATLVAVVIALSGLALLEGACNGLRALYRSAWAAGVDARLRPGLLARHLQRAEGAGDPASWLAEAGRLRGAVCGPFTEALVDLPLLLLLHAALFLVSPTCGLVALGCAVGVLGVQVATTRALVQRQRALLPAARDAAIFAGLAGRHARAWRSLGVAPGLVLGFARVDAEQVGLSAGVEARQALAREAVQTLLRLQAVLLLGVGAHEVLAGSLGAGGLVACNLLAARLAQPWMRLLAGMEAVATARHARERLGLLLAGRLLPVLHRRAGPGPQATSRLVLHELAPGGQWVRRPGALEGHALSGTWPAGARLALLVADPVARGAAFDALVAGAEPAGAARWQDGAGAGVPLAEIARGVAGVAPILPGPLALNLRLADPAAPDRRLHEALRDVGLGDWCAGLPEGLETLLSPAVGDAVPAFGLRLSLARALVAEPPVLVLELDARQAREAEEAGLWARLAERRAHTTLLLVGADPDSPPAGFESWCLTPAAATVTAGTQPAGSRA
jgi:ABC-type bacteriocin/lantibiotic exporter with double-glycine peptidase domain